MDFADLGLDAKILKAADDLGWTEPTPIQAEAVPVGLRGEDIMAACGQLKSATERARKSKARIEAEAGLA